MDRIIVEVVVLPNSLLDLRLVEGVVFVRDVLALAVLLDFLRNIGTSIEPTFEQLGLDSPYAMKTLNRKLVDFQQSVVLKNYKKSK